MFTIIVDKKTGQPLQFAPTSELTARDIKIGVAQLTAPMRNKKERRREVLVVEAASPPPFSGAKWDFDRGDWRGRNKKSFLVSADGRTRAVVLGYTDDKLPTPVGGDCWVDKPRPKHIKNCVWHHDRQDWIRPERALVVDADGAVINMIRVGPLGVEGLTPPDGCKFLMMPEDIEVGIGWRQRRDGSFARPKTKDENKKV